MFIPYFVYLFMCGGTFGFVTQVYVPRLFVSSQQRFGVMDIKAPSACHSSQVLDRPCYSSQVSNGPCYSSQRNQCYSSVLQLYLEDCRKIHLRGVRARGPSADEWIRKLWYIYTMEYYSAIKKNTFESVLTDFLKRKLDCVYVILSLSGDTSLFASTPCIPSTFPFRRLCSPLPTPHSAYKSFPLRIT